MYFYTFATFASLPVMTCLYTTIYHKTFLHNLLFNKFIHIIEVDVCSNTVIVSVCIVTIVVGRNMVLADSYSVHEWDHRNLRKNLRIEIHRNPNDRDYQAHSDKYVTLSIF